MLLSDLRNIININKILNIKNKKIFNRLSISSKNLNKYSIFITNFNYKIKKEYIYEAINKKIPAIITNRLIKNSITQFLVKDIEKETRKLLFHLKPYKPDKTIAVTGTNGKTSTCWYISEICRLNNVKIKMQGTLGYYVNGKKNKNELLTTPDHITLHQNAFSRLKNQYNFVFECSSHALEQDRIKEFPINIAAITNISHDHLDYHKNFNSYVNAKFKLFSKYLDSNGIAIINSRLRFLNKLIKILKNQKIKIFLYGNKNIFINRKKNNEFILTINSNKYLLKNLNLSKFDIENLECAITCCLQLNISKKNIVNCLKKLRPPPGRSEIIYFNKISSKIIVDYAHTPDALKNILLANTFKNKKPSLIFGCGGNRDKLKRKLMGKIAFKFADKVIITDDNPRNEKPNEIRSEIIKYCPKAIEISNRKKAILETIKNLDKKTILIIAGKGHEKKQIFANKTIKFDDVLISKKAIRECQKKI